MSFWIAEIINIPNVRKLRAINARWGAYICITCTVNEKSNLAIFVCRSFRKPILRS